MYNTLCKYRDYFEIKYNTLNYFSDYQHDPALVLNEGVRVMHHYGIDLGGCHRLTVLADVQLPAVDDIRYLFGPEASSPFGKDVQYGFLYLHLQRPDEMVTNSTVPSI